MTRVIVGTYRRDAHVFTCIDSLTRHLHGVSDIVFVDDSGDDSHCDRLEDFGRVIRCNSVGYTRAMQSVCSAAEGSAAFVLEEDFTFNVDVSLDEMHEILWHRPYLAQVALIRQPWFPVEVQHGGVLEALTARGEVMRDVGGVIEQTATFTCNPSLWRADVFVRGWPQRVKWSEERKRDQLLSAGYRFGYMPGVRVTHHGERVGHGY